MKDILGANLKKGAEQYETAAKALTKMQEDLERYTKKAREMIKEGANPWSSWDVPSEWAAPHPIQGHRHPYTHSAPTEQELKTIIDDVVVGLLNAMIFTLLKLRYAVLDKAR